MASEGDPRNKETREEDPESGSVVPVASLFVVVKNTFWFNRCEADKWLLRHIWRPIDTHNKTWMDFWIAKVSKHRSAFDWDLINEDIDMPSLVRFKPESHVYFMSERYALVILLDVSPSLATVCTSTHTTLLLLAFELICNIAKGICQPFTLGNGIIIHPQISLTVIADYASSLQSKTISIDPIRILLKDFILSYSNLDQAFSLLFTSLRKYESDCVKLRHTKKQPAPSPQPPSFLPDETSTAGCVYDSLEYGLFELDLSQKDHSPALILITDGVSTGSGLPETRYRDLCRRIAKRFAAFTVVQVGSSGGFSPAVSFGHIPDNEFLRFIAMAAFGKFLYESDCPKINDISPDVLMPPNFYHQHFLIRSKTLQKTDDNPMRTVHAVPPERLVDIPRSRLINNTIDTTRQITDEERLFPWIPNSKAPLVTNIISKNYREYLINTNIDYLVSVRLLDGFTLKSITNVPQKNGTSKAEIILVLPWLPNVTIQYIIKTSWNPALNRPLLQSSVVTSLRDKPPRIQLNVLSHYAFAILFINAQNLDQSVGYHTMQDKLRKLHEYFKEVDRVDEFVAVVAGFNSKAARVAIASATMPSGSMGMGGVQGGPGGVSAAAMGTGMVGMGSVSRSPSGFDLSRKPPGLGSRVEMTFDFPVNFTAQMGEIKFGISDRPTNYWHVVSQIMHTKSNMFQKFEFDVILNFNNVGSTSSLIGRIGGKQNGMSELVNYLTEWSSFMVNVHTYVKFQMEEGEGGEQVPVGLVVLTVGVKTVALVSLRILFFAVGVKARRRVVRELIKGLDGLISVIGANGGGLSGEGEERSVVVCKKPVRGVAVLYGDDDETRYDSTNEEPHPNFEEINTELSSSLLSSPLVKCYLRHHRWIWCIPSTSTSSTSPTTTYETPITSTIYDLLYLRRTHTHFLQISNPTSPLTLYRELEIPFLPIELLPIHLLRKRKPEPRVCSVQYILRKFEGWVVSEVWMEPSVVADEDGKVGEFFEDVKRRVGESDSAVVDCVYTFEKLCGLVLCGEIEMSVGGVRKESKDGIEGCDVVYARFRVGEIIRRAPFMIVGYPLPQISESVGDEDDVNFFTALHGYILEELAKICVQVPNELLRLETLEEKNDLMREIKGVIGDKYVLGEIKESNLFVRKESVVRDTLLILLIPDLSCVSTSGEMKKAFLGVTLFECTRASYSNPLSTVPEDDVFVISPVKSQLKLDFVSEQESGSDDEGDTFSHVVATGGGLMQRKASNESEDENLKRADGVLGEFERKVKEVYEGAFARTIYRGLLKGYRDEWSHVDIENVLEICEQSDINVDITEYLNVQTMLAEKFSGGYVSLNSRADPLISVLKQSFEPFGTDNVAYYYRPPAPLSPSRILQCAHSPLFLKTEYSFSKLKQIDAEHLHLPMNLLPKSYRVAGDDDPTITADYTPKSIGTGASPIASGDGTKAELHLCCLYVPSAISSLDSESPFLPSSKKPAVENLKKQISWMLDDEVVHGLLHLLPLHENPISLLGYIDKTLHTRHNSESLLLTRAENPDGNMSFGNECKSVLWELPLRFVKTPVSESKAAQIFGESLMENELLFKRYGEYFVAEGWKGVKKGMVYPVQSKTYMNGISEVVLSNGSLVTDVGLVVKLPEQKSAEVNALEVMKAGKKDEFWVIVKILEDRVQLLFFSMDYEGLHQESVIIVVKQNILSCVERVNKMLLLLDLNDSKNASKYLIPPHPYNGADMSDDDDSFDINEPESESFPQFEVGQFACPVVFTHIFELHPRVKPSQAIYAIDDTIHPLSISNRSHMCVSATKSAIYYIRILETEIEDHGQGFPISAIVAVREDAMTQRQNSRIRTSSGISSEAVNDPQIFVKSPPRTRAVSSNIVLPISTATVPTHKHQHAVKIEVYGIDPAVPEITEQFVAMIGARLLNLTQTILSGIISRNVVVKLISADLDFLLPKISDDQSTRIEKMSSDFESRNNYPSSTPNSYLKSEIPLPTAIQSVFVFMMLLRQNLLIDSMAGMPHGNEQPTRKIPEMSPRSKSQSNAEVSTSLDIVHNPSRSDGYLHALIGSDVVHVLERHYENIGLYSASQSHVANSQQCELQLDEFAFLYNCAHFKQSHSENYFGTGIATVIFQVIDTETDKVVLVFPALSADGYNLRGDVGSDTDYKRLSHPGSVTTNSTPISNWGNRFVEGFKLGSLSPPRSNPHTDPSKPKSYKVMVEIWSQGGVDISLLLNRIKLSVNESVSDFMVEAIVTKLTNSLRQEPRFNLEDFDHTKFDENIQSQQAIPIGERPPPTHLDSSFSEFMEISKVVFANAVKSNSSSVRHLSASVHLPGWIIEDFATEVQNILSFAEKQNPPVGSAMKSTGAERKAIVHTPIFAKQMLFSSFKTPPSMISRDPLSPSSQVVVHELCDPQSQNGLMRNEGIDQLVRADAYVAVLGIEELDTRYGSPRVHNESSGEQNLDRNPSNASTRSTRSYSSSALQRKSRKPSNEDLSIGGDFILLEPVKIVPIQQLAPPSLVSQLIAHRTGVLNPLYQEFGSKSSFVSVILEHSRLRIYTYNVNLEYCDTLFQKFWRLISWNNLRMQYLERDLALLTWGPSLDVRTITGTMIVDGYMSTMNSNQRKHELRTIVAGIGSFAGHSSPVQFDASSDSSRRTLYSMRSDPLQRHAVDYIDYFVRNIYFHLTDILHARLSTNNNVIGRILSTTKPDENISRSYSDVAMILRSVQLLHFAKYPLFISELHPVVPTLQKDIDALSITSAPQASTNDFSFSHQPEYRVYQDHINSIISSYREYLEMLGMEALSNSRRSAQGEMEEKFGFGAKPLIPETRPQFAISNSMTIDTDVVYLAKVFEQGVVIVQIGVDGIHLCLHMYTIRFLGGGIGERNDNVLGLSSLRESDSFTTDSQRLRADIHFNSFAFDFHIRMFFDFLEGNLLPPPDFDVFESMRSFISFNQRKPAFAHSRIHSGITVNNTFDASDSIFKFILRNPERYGFKGLEYNGATVGCYLLSRNPKFKDNDKGDDDQHPYRYCILVYSTEEPVVMSLSRENSQNHSSEHQSPRTPLLTTTNDRRKASTQITLNYVLLADNDRSRAHIEISESSNLLSESFLQGDDVNREYLGGGYYFTDVIKNAEKCIEKMVDQAVKFCGRDNLWRKLINWDSAHFKSVRENAGLLERQFSTDWINLFLERMSPNSRSVFSIDPELVKIFAEPTANFVEMLEFLKDYYFGKTREFLELNGTRHLMIINPSNPDYLMHFILRNVVTSSAEELVDSATSRNSLDNIFPHLRRKRTPSAKSSTRSPAEMVPYTYPDPQRQRILDDFKIRPPQFGDEVLDILLISREGIADAVEYEQIQDIVTSISYWNWLRS
ncbi:hypothetical protein HK098_003371 [Nowakowskiella sp. JEL0407]|nr:hypothetical protein HK098_003371 [Nowakowskiella sp. JEL0407]